MRYLIIAGILAVSLSAHALRLSEPVQVDEMSETFGTPIDELPKIVKISDLLEAPSRFDEMVFSVKAEVSKVCQKKGCFFIAQQDGKVIRVAFKDYSFFVPTDISGRMVTLVGELSAHEISPKQAKHFNKDLGAPVDGKAGTASIKSGRFYEIIARSVRVPKK